jgi:hypothetical protein
VIDDEARDRAERVLPRAGVAPGQAEAAAKDDEPSLSLLGDLQDHLFRLTAPKDQVRGAAVGG